jgi:hypothetical protein
MVIWNKINNIHQIQSIYVKTHCLYKQIMSSFRHRWPWTVLSILFKAFWFYCSQNFKLFGFPVFRFWAYRIKGNPETRYKQCVLTYIDCIWCILLILFHMTISLALHFSRFYEPKGVLDNYATDNISLKYDGPWNLLSYQVIRVITEILSTSLSNTHSRLTSLNNNCLMF